MNQAVKSRMTSEQKEAYHRDAESRIQRFKYSKPDVFDDRMPKQFISLFRSDLIRLAVQVVKEGGENNLHYHTGGDNAWMVLRGAARFYGVGDVLLGEFGPNEGILLPGGSRYWFEKVSDEDLEILQIVCKETRSAETTRINVEPHKDWMTDDFLQIYDGQKAG